MNGSSLTRRSLFATAGATAVAAATVPVVAGATPSIADTGPPEGPTAALVRLLAGNRRFKRGDSRHPRQTPRTVRELAAGQAPFVVVLGCADSRVPPEVLFDQGLGDVFDNRVAGNIVDDLLLGSIEYAIEHFAPPLLMVLGHERCGAVTAAIETIQSGGTAPGHIAAIVDALRPILEPVLDEPGDPVENGVVANIRAQRAALVEGSEVVREHLDTGQLAVIGARYDLDSGAVTLVR